MASFAVFAPGQKSSSSGLQGYNLKVLFIQYANPGAYPPLEHSTRILADNGYEVEVVGVGMLGTERLSFAPHPKIEMRLLKYCVPGWRQKIHYLRFGFLTLSRVLRRRPDWIYVSDPLACPIAWLLAVFGPWRQIYHEHDSPALRKPSLFMQFVFWTRRQVAQQAEFCVLPNRERVELFREATETTRPVLCVWNCPRRQEVFPPALPSEQFTVYYHGNIGPNLVPITLLKAVAMVPGVKLLVVGYSTYGSHPYLKILHQEISRLKIADRVEIRPALSRQDLLEVTRTAHVGWAVIPDLPDNINFRQIVGASNKVFDYLACGVPALVANLPHWEELYVKTGCGMACDPNNPTGIAQALRWFMEHPDESRLMGERGRWKILSEWNYETEFQKVFDLMKAPARSQGREAIPKVAAAGTFARENLVKVLNILYANPGAYPPLEHSTRILADNGCEVRVLGIGTTGTEELILPSHPKIKVGLMQSCLPGWRQKLHFLRFILWAGFTAIRWRPEWVYVSDPLACPAAWLLIPPTI
jgi:glycosyltransferase involved in cell wall biosynthesis